MNQFWFDSVADWWSYEVLKVSTFGGIAEVSAFERAFGERSVPQTLTIPTSR